MSQFGKGKFLSRFFKLRHLEFDSALQQIVWTVINPKRVFRYHKDQYAMRGRWSRDDPAMLLLLLGYVTVVSLGYCGWMRVPVGSYFAALAWTLLVDCLALGVLIASILWFLCNKLLAVQSTALSQSVEWAYCFDIHLNAVLPFSLLLYGPQMLLWIPLSSTSILSVLTSNTLWLLTLCYYLYIVFLGCTILPSAQHTMSLLYAALPLMLLYVIAIPLKINATRIFTYIFAWRIGAGNVLL
ncbi:protein unc-50 homolog isoform X2 [Halichondria panicea]|uniref:protein unc-50 homolog isoform X2 n=1 Tax=Halichondria panicea TaxID=6063 RepID=UPI00312B3801